VTAAAAAAAATAPAADDVTSGPPAEHYHDTCAVCLSEFEGGEPVAQLPCSPLHTFHQACVLPWLRKERRCPLCVADIDEPPPLALPPPPPARSPLQPRRH
jgi:hypothetical protein